MKSWDYFDTLHGRATGAEPWRLFDLVAGEEYRRVRQLAETQSNKTWPGIWTSMARLTGWPPSRIRDLQAREWEAELAAGFPILENCCQVQAGDRIVTDTYFSESQVRELASKIGIPESVEIVASWDGKWTGKWWQTPSARAVEVHVGDNPRSDVAAASNAGVAALLYGGGAWTEHERRLADAGLWDVAGAARAARLQNPYCAGTAAADCWDGAAAANVPFLLMAAAMVRRYVEIADPRRVLFVSRDAILLERAYAKLYGGETGIFHCSRQTLRYPSASFLAYAGRVSPGTLFVDLHGTGRTIREFTKRHGVDMSCVFVCGQKRLDTHAPALVVLDGLASGTAVEVMNYHDEGRVVDVSADGEPIRAPVEYDLELVRAHRAATLCGISAACRPPIGVTGDAVVQAAAVITKLLSRRLRAQHQVDHAALANGSGGSR